MLVEPNVFAYMMLVLWPLFSWQLWRRIDPARALVWTVLGGYLFMPPMTAINFPIIPDLDKISIPNLTALCAAIYVRKDKIQFLPEGKIGRVLIVLYVLSPFATVLTNGDPLYFAMSFVQGMRIYDSVAAVTYQAIDLLPFILARHYLGSPQGNRAVLEALVLAGLIYSVPMLIEVRLSPQINVWIYGFFQHDFAQTIRQGGFRPVVFLPHGLWVAFFALMCLLAAMIRLREVRPDARPKALGVMLYLAVVLFFCKSVGPMVFAACMSPLLLLTSWRTQLRVAAILAGIVVLYPMLRGANLVPVDQIVAFADQFSSDRADSLQFRIDNENQLLARAQERVLFGWGGYGRAFLHNPLTGEMTSIADGFWVIVMGTYGWLGYIAEFGLTALPLLALGRQAFAKQVVPANRYTAGLALILAANMVDLIPNATHIPFTWLMAGALLGQAERVHRQLADQGQGEVRDGQHGRKPKRTVI